RERVECVLEVKRLDRFRRLFDDGRIWIAQSGAHRDEASFEEQARLHGVQDGDFYRALGALEELFERREHSVELELRELLGEADARVHEERSRGGVFWYAFHGERRQTREQRLSPDQIRPTLVQQHIGARFRRAALLFPLEQVDVPNVWEMIL